MTKTKQKTLSYLIKSCKFDYVNKNIEKLFKTELIRGNIEVKNFGKCMTSEQVIAELEKDGCVPANATELFAWQLENPDWFKDKRSYGGVVALGSIASFEGRRRVPCSWWSDARRRAGLGWFGGDWYSDYWFAFSRKSDLGTSDTQNSALRTLDLSLEKRVKALEDQMEKLKSAFIK